MTLSPTNADATIADKTTTAKRPEHPARQWWRSMQRLRADGSSNPGADPATLARLRRCATPGEALMQSETIRLCRRLGCRGAEDPRIESIAVLAVVLAHVREDGGPWPKLGKCLAEKRKGGDQPLLSELRLRRLLAARDGMELLRGFREAVALLGDTSPVEDLARLILAWRDPKRGERTRTRFLFDYHDDAAYAPPKLNESDSADRPS